MQVADRWLLSRNLGEAAKVAVTRHTGSTLWRPPVSSWPGTAAHRTDRYPDAGLACRGAPAAGRGRSIDDIAGTLTLSRNTVRRLAAPPADELLVRDGTGRRLSILDEYTA